MSLSKTMLFSLKRNYFSFKSPGALHFLFVNSTVSEINFIIYPAMHIINTFLANHAKMQSESYSEDNLQLGDNSSQLTP